MYSAASIILLHQQAHLRSVLFSPGSEAIYLHYKLGRTECVAPKSHRLPDLNMKELPSSSQANCSLHHHATNLLHRDPVFLWSHTHLFVYRVDENYIGYMNICTSVMDMEMHLLLYQKDKNWRPSVRGTIMVLNLDQPWRSLRWNYSCTYSIKMSPLPDPVLLLLLRKRCPILKTEALNKLSHWLQA